MIRIKKLSWILLSCVYLTSCVVGQHLKLDHNPVENQSKKQDKSISLSVNDQRIYVLNKNKEDYFIGKYRSGFGIPYDVSNYKKVPLAEQMQTDLKEELASLGFDLAQGDKTLEVNIKEWNFDAMQNAKFLYAIQVVLKNNSETIYAKTFEDIEIFKGNLWSAGKGAIEKSLPVSYNKIIDELIRGNDELIEKIKS